MGGLFALPPRDREFRRCTRRRPAPPPPLRFFFCGFSPFEVAHVLGGHLVLTMNFAPPLCALLVLLLVGGAIARIRFVMGLALVLFIQCLISTEILASMTLFGALALVGAMVLIPLERPRLRAIFVPIACGYTAAALIAAPFLYYAFVKGAPPENRDLPHASFFSADLFELRGPGAIDAHLFTRYSRPHLSVCGQSMGKRILSEFPAVVGSRSLFLAPPAGTNSSPAVPSFADCRGRGTRACPCRINGHQLIALPWAGAGDLAFH